MSISPPEGADALLKEPLIALSQEIIRLKTDLQALRARLNADALGDLRDVAQLMRDVEQWTAIALEMEKHFDNRTTAATEPTRRDRELDLADARASIGRKLDRLRAAAGATGVSGEPH